MSENHADGGVSQIDSSKDQRGAKRIIPGDIVMVNGITVDSVLKKYTPFKAKVLDVSDSGMQLSANGSFQAVKGTKIIITQSRERTGDTRNLIIVWLKSREGETLFGCQYND